MSAAELKISIETSSLVYRCTSRDPAFAAFKSFADLVRVLFSKFRPRGVTVADIRIDNAAALNDAAVHCTLFNRSVSIQYRLEWVEVVIGLGAPQLELFKLADDALSVLREFDPSFQPAKQSVALFIQAAVVQGNLKEWFSRRVQRTDGVLSEPTGLSFGAEPDTGHGAALVEHSLSVQKGVFVKCEWRTDVPASTEHVCSSAAKFTEAALFQLGFETVAHVPR